MSSSNSKSNLVAIAVVAILGLLGLSGYLFYVNQNLKQINEDSVKTISAKDDALDELNNTYYDAVNKLDAMTGTNEELNALIEKQKDELKAKKKSIGKLLRNKNDLVKARSEMAEMRTQLDGYITEINQLKAENQELVAKTVELDNQNKNLQSDLQSRISQTEELETARAQLVSEKEDLASKNAALGQKVNVASVIKVANVNVTGWKNRRNGKSAKKKYAKNIDRLELCFNTSDNAVAAPGDELFQVRIINPAGETLAVEDLGSGFMKDKNTNQDIRFTKAEMVEYDNEAGNVCLNWEQNTPFNKGNYQVEVYNKGYLAGTGEFRLK